MEALIKQLRQNGAKITVTRRSLIELFGRYKKPLTAQELLGLLVTHYQLEVNKTTMYRELDFLTGQEIIRTIYLNDRHTRFELSALPHHHHLVCNSCQDIQEITIEHPLTQVERQLKKKNKFTLIQHSLEFFGLCQKCTK